MAAVRGLGEPENGNETSFSIVNATTQQTQLTIRTYWHGFITIC
jgi:hypothetical protein